MDEPKKIALALPFIDADATNYLAEAVSENWVTSGGPAVTKFENQRFKPSSKSRTYKHQSL